LDVPDDATDSPDVVLGQPDFNQNNPGTDLDQMNWPAAVTVAEGGSPLIVADTCNNRLLVWTTFPTANGQATDYAIQGLALDVTTPMPEPTPSSHDNARAMAGQAPDVFLGATGENDSGANIGDTGLFWPSELAFEGNALWVGEYKFSGRAVRFSTQ
jgi:hypothetical protein